MAITGDYSFQTAGVVMTGASTVINNVTNVKIDVKDETTEVGRIVAGDTAPKIITTLRFVRITAVISVLDEEDADATLNDYQVGAANATDLTLRIRPEGTGSPKTELILTPGAGFKGMTLKSKSTDFKRGKDLPPVTADMTWEGTFAAEPAWTEQA